MTVSQPFAYTTGTLGTALDTIAYGYGDSEWKDLLTSYDGQMLASDEIGNLTNDGTWSYSWQHGRQLKQMSRPDASGETEMIRFRYDSSGHRIGKDSGVYHISYSGGEIVYAGETTRTSYSYLCHRTHNKTPRPLPEGVGFFMQTGPRARRPAGDR